MLLAYLFVRHILNLRAELAGPAKEPSDVRAAYDARMSIVRAQDLSPKPSPATTAPKSARFCACGCGQELDGGTSRRQYYDDACRQRANRAKG